MQCSPIILFVYKRLDCTQKCIEALKKNELCEASDLYIFSDAAANAQDIVKVDAVRSYIMNISGFKNITTIIAEENKGLANSIISGVSQIIEKHGKAIVLEDDLVVSKNFLIFMNKALSYYENEEQIASISGFTLPINLPSDYSYDVYFTKRSFSWGWATWHNRWEKVDWDVSDYNSFSTDKQKQKNFNQMGSDLSPMLKKQMQNQINSWAIRWCYHQYKNQMLNIFPVQSKVLNEGFNLDATHSSLNNTRYKTYMGKEDQTDFVFTEDKRINEKIIDQFLKHFSIKTRVYYKIIDLINKMR